MNDGIVPFKVERVTTNDPVIQKESLTQERVLLYIIAIRAKKEVVVTSFGEPNKFLGTIIAIIKSSPGIRSLNLQKGRITV